MASGTNGTLLSEAEATAARARARSTSGAAPVAKIRKEAEAAESAGDEARARRLWTWLAEVPGDDARRHLDTLKNQRRPRNPLSTDRLK